MHPTRCTTCIVPSDTKGVEFDEQGICEFCRRQSAPASGPSGEHLARRIEEIREGGRGKPYDCLVGLSGGRDSSFLLHCLVEKHGLRCMAAYHRTPFTPDAIDSNVRRLCKRLDVPLVEMDIPREPHRRFARRMVRFWLEDRQSILANLACAPCKFHNLEVYRVARRHGIPCIVFGGNRLEEFPIGSGQRKKQTAGEHQEVSAFQHLRQTLAVTARGGVFLLRKPRLLADLPLIFRASILYLNNRTPYLRAKFSRIRMFDYFYVAGYDEAEVEATLRSIGWVVPPGCNSSWRADCAFNELKNYFFQRTHGMTYVDAYLGNMVRRGLLDRERALTRAEREGAISAERIREVCGILDIEPEVFLADLPRPELRQAEARA